MKPSKNILHRINKYFPYVTKVIDAKKPVLISVEKKDCKAGRKKDPANCALAKACVRQELVDGAIINIGTSYLIRGEVATRYLTSGTVGREIVSFDRHNDFSIGKNYRLSAVSKTMRLGKRGGPSGKHKSPRGKGNPFKKVHRTNRIRVSKPD